jgi:hypothetical protein
VAAVRVPKMLDVASLDGPGRTPFFLRPAARKRSHPGWSFKRRPCSANRVFSFGLVDANFFDVITGLIAD